MKNASRTIVLLFVVSIVFTPLSFAEAQNEFGGLKDVESAKAVFDVRTGDVKSAALHLKLIHEMFTGLADAGKSPVFEVVFLGPAVKFISKSREGFSPEDQKSLDEISQTISAMSRDGIGLEICLIAARLNNVDPASVLPEIRQIENGWHSVIGYQQQGYALVPVY